MISGAGYQHWLPSRKVTVTLPQYQYQSFIRRMGGGNNKRTRPGEGAHAERERERWWEEERS